MHLEQSPKAWKRTGRLSNQRTSGDHAYHSIIKIDQNTEKSPGDIEETCYHSNSSERPSTNIVVKNLQGIT